MNMTETSASIKTCTGPRSRPLCHINFKTFEAGWGLAAVLYPFSLLYSGVRVNESKRVKTVKVKQKQKLINEWVPSTRPSLFS